MSKTDLLFQMLEYPEQYSEAQWRVILADNECRELYTLMAKAKSASQSSQVTDDEIDAEWERLAKMKHHQTAVIPLWRKIAAAAAIIIALFGFTYAAVNTEFFGVKKLLTSKKIVLSDKKNATNETKSNVKEILNDEELVKELPIQAEPHLYDNVPLEQILSEISAYYHVKVEYNSEDVRSLRLYYQWEPDYSLDKVVEMLSNFDAFNIQLEGDKLIVESSSQESQQ